MNIISPEAYYSYLECFDLFTTEQLRCERKVILGNVIALEPGAHAERAQDMLSAVNDLLINREDTECVEVPND